MQTLLALFAASRVKGAAMMLEVMAATKKKRESKERRALLMYQCIRLTSKVDDVVEASWRQARLGETLNRSSTKKYHKVLRINLTRCCICTYNDAL